MPLRNLPPEWIEYLMGLAIFVWAASIGAAAKVASEVKMGIREKFFSVDLLLVIPSVFMAGMLAYGIASYYTLPLAISMGLGTLSGYAGTRFADFILLKIEKGRKDAN